MNKNTTRVTIIAVGVDEYLDPHLKKLKGPKHDLVNIKKLFVESPKIALYNKAQFMELYNPEAAELRQFINEYVMTRTADGDLLIFYFSGHGVAIGRDDFGFCTTDTLIHPITSTTIPLSVVKFSELLNSFYVANIIPIIIIDACYSGIAGKALIITPTEAISIMQHQLDVLQASSYALFCSCGSNQTTLDTKIGGIFSRYLLESALHGKSTKKGDTQFLTLVDIYPELQKKVLTHPGDITPKLFLGPTLPEFPVCLNIQYKQHSYSLSHHLASVLEALWNNGQPQELTPKEIDTICGKGAYGNHNKLSFAPWGLVENVPNTRKRRLTQRGIDFMLDKIKVPRTVVENRQTGNWVDAENAPLLSTELH